MKTSGVALGLCLVYLLLSSAAEAQTLADVSSLPGAGQPVVGGFLAFSEVEYESDNFEWEVERKVLGAELAYGFTDSVAFIAQLGLSLDAEVERVNADGDGYMLGLGLKGLAYRSGGISIVSYGFLNQLDEDYDGRGVDSEIKVLDLHLGALARLVAHPTFQLHAGLDLVPYSDGEFESSGTSGVDLERDRWLGLRLGAAWRLGRATFRPEVIMLAEQTIIIGVLYSL